MSVLTNLVAVRELIADPVNHTTKVYARDTWGFPVDPRDPEASCFCTIGAVIHVTEGQDRIVAYLTEDAIYDAVKAYEYGASAVAINDEWGHMGALAILDDAIAREEARS